MPDPTATMARDHAEMVARSHYGKLLALIARRTRDVAAAEDALSEAFAAALSTWPVKGVPDNPQGWLLTVARHSAGQAHRKGIVRANAQDVIEMIYDEAQSTANADGVDDRLRLLFVCAHPAIDVTVRAPLMLQTVLGIDANRIGQSFFVKGTTIGQRLVRAKAKMRDAGISFEMPDADHVRERLNDVMAAIYAAFTIGWSDLDAYEQEGAAFIDEALFLARMVADALPEQAEPKGLLSLMLYCEARRPARTMPDGSFVPLEQQDARLWSSDMIGRAEAWLRRAASLGAPGRYQTEAAIQSFHVQRAQSPHLPGAALLGLYDLLVTQTESLGAAIARAAAYARFGDAKTALAHLDALPRAEVENHQPYWVARASVLVALGERAAAATALDTAINHTSDTHLRQHLRAKRTMLLQC
jgi:RNA polymerase sigma-70 factor, ECF subfamily